MHLRKEDSYSSDSDPNTSFSSQEAEVYAYGQPMLSSINPPVSNLLADKITKKQYQGYSEFIKQKKHEESVQKAPAAQYQNQTSFEVLVNHKNASNHKQEKNNRLSYHAKASKSQNPIRIELSEYPDSQSKLAMESIQTNPTNPRLPQSSSWLYYKDLLEQEIRKNRQLQHMLFIREKQIIELKSQYEVICNNLENTSPSECLEPKNRDKIIRLIKNQQKRSHKKSSYHFCSPSKEAAHLMSPKHTQSPKITLSSPDLFCSEFLKFPTDSLIKKSLERNVSSFKLRASELRNTSEKLEEYEQKIKQLKKDNIKYKKFINAMAESIAIVNGVGPSTTGSVKNLKQIWQNWKRLMETILRQRKGIKK